MIYERLNVQFIEPGIAHDNPYKEPELIFEPVGAFGMVVIFVEPNL